MAEILCDTELEKLLDNVIVDGDASCIRPNSYVIRLGKAGAFLNSGREFKLGTNKKGIRIWPGHSVALSAYETLDFRRDTVHQIFPGCDLHAFISPTTDLSREGIVAPTTQVDAGYYGTLNWTINNTSNKRREYIYGEDIFRVTIFKLEDGETPDQVYDGNYQNQTGYVPSKRKGPPVGMRTREWENSLEDDSPEKLVDNLIESGYPWSILGKKLITIGDEFKQVTEEYDMIGKSIDNISKKYETANEKIPGIVRKAFSEEASNIQTKWLLNSGSLLMAVAGMVVTILSNDKAFQFLEAHGPIVGILLLLFGIGALVLISMNKKK